MERADAARAATDRLFSAIVAGDPSAITSLMSTKAQGELLQAVRRWGVDVATAEDAAARVWGGSWTALLRDVRADNVQLEGDGATVTYRHPTYGRDPDDLLRLREIDGQWLLDEFVDDRDENDSPPWAFPS